MFEYEIWFDGCVVRYDRGFDSSDEALEDAECVIKYDLMEEYEDTVYDDYVVEVYEM